MNPRNRKAMFAKRGREYLPLNEAKEKFDQLKYENNLDTPLELIAFSKTKKYPKDVPQRPDLIYGRLNMTRNHLEGINTGKHVFDMLSRKHKRNSRIDLGKVAQWLSDNMGSPASLLRDPKLAEQMEAAFVNMAVGAGQQQAQPPGQARRGGPPAGGTR